MLKEESLMNGVKLLLYPINNAEKRITIRLIIKAGAMDDRRLPGIAHFTEHMQLSHDRMFLLKNHDHFTVCGQTRLEYTIYDFNCASNKDSLKIVFNIISNMLNGVYLEEQFMEIIRKDILAEKKRFDTKKRILEDYKILTKRQKLPIGSEENIREISFADIKGFFCDLYTSVPIGICVAGNFDEVWVKDIYSETIISELKDNEKHQSEGENKQVIKYIKRSNDLSIYIPKSPMDSESLKERAETDIVMMVIEDCLERFLVKESFDKVFIANALIRYSKAFQFIRYTADNIFGYTQSGLGWSDIMGFILNNTKAPLVEAVKEQYGDYIRNNYEICNEDAIQELTNNFVYNNECFQKERYLNELEKTDGKDVRYRINTLLDKKIEEYSLLPCTDR